MEKELLSHPAHADTTSMSLIFRCRKCFDSSLLDDQPQEVRTDSQMSDSHLPDVPLQISISLKHHIKDVGSSEDSSTCWSWGANGRKKPSSNGSTPQGTKYLPTSSEKHFNSWLAVRGPVFLEAGFIGMPLFDNTEGLKLDYCTYCISAG